MSASFARIQKQGTDLNGLKIWQSDVPIWQRACIDVSRQQAATASSSDSKRSSFKSELDFLNNNLLDELDALSESETFQGEEKRIELREVGGQLELIKDRSIVFFSREKSLDYSVRELPISSASRQQTTTRKTDAAGGSKTCHHNASD